MTIPQITIMNKDPDHLHLDGINNVTAYTLKLDIPIRELSQIIIRSFKKESSAKVNQ